MLPAATPVLQARAPICRPYKLIVTKGADEQTIKCKDEEDAFNKATPWVKDGYITRIADEEGTIKWTQSIYGLRMGDDVPLPPSNDPPPISREDLKALFDYLDRPNPDPCTNTFKETIAFLKSRNLPVAETIEWLEYNGAGCDCEVIFNTEGDWGEWAGRVPMEEE
jgi:hypothetical protein